jgi:hypothetical protein
VITRQHEEPMAEETKKPKIDLKARLGKTMVANSGGSAPVPLPVPAGASPIPGMPGSSPSSPPGDLPGGDRISAPPASTPLPARAAPVARPSGMGIAPPPGMLSPGIPLPAFAPAVQPKPAAAPAAPQGGAAQTIKVEIGEEVQEERKRAGRQKVIFAFIGAFVGIGLGFVAGGQSADSKRSKGAQSGAAALEKEVSDANKKMAELGVLVDQGVEALGAKKYPDDLSKSLSELAIAFDANTLSGKNVGALPAKAFRSLLVYTKEVEGLNEKKDSLRNLLSAMKKPVEAAWEDEKDPKFAFTVIFQGSEEKMTAELVKVKDPFKIKGDWPKEFPIIKKEMQQGKRVDAEKPAQRWLGKGLTGEKPQAIPVDPASVAAFTTDQIVIQLRKGLYDTKILLEGDKSDPQNETPGLIKLGETLASELNQVALAK